MYQHVYRTTIFTIHYIDTQKQEEESNTVSLDLLTSADLASIKKSSHTVNDKVYLVLTYAVAFDR